VAEIVACDQGIGRAMQNLRRDDRFDCSVVRGIGPNSHAASSARYLGQGDDGNAPNAQNPTRATAARR